MDRASYLISELAGGLLCRKVDVFPRQYRPRAVKLKYERVNDLLGLNLSRAKMQDLVSRTGANVEDLDDYLHVEVPSHRNDIENDVDLIEEVARLYGYPRISSEAPMIVVEAMPVNESRKKINSLKHLFCSRGYYEVINYSFMNPDVIETLKIGKDDPRTKAVKIVNPLRQEESLVRTSLVPSLLDNLIHNYHRGAKIIKIFEISKVFTNKNSKGEKLPQEGTRIGGLSLDEKEHQLWNSNIDDFFSVKGDIDAMVKELSILSGRWERSKEPFLHPGRSADLIINKKKAGFIGILSPEVIRKLDLKMHGVDTVLFEFDLDLLFASTEKRDVYERFSRYPHVQRDISLLVDTDKSAQDVLSIIASFKSDLLFDTRVFDFYRGKNIPEGRVSLAFSVTYGSYDRTLSEEEIDAVHNDLVEYVIDKTGGELRS
jgi:phenylalanyl-tRNA synthetase beta chain